MSVDLHYSTARVRRGALHFLFGKVGSAALNFSALILVARLLVMVDYAYYVAALATVELGLAFGSFGLDWVAARYLPEYRVLAPQNILKRFIWRLVGLQSTIYLGFAIAMALGSTAIATMLGTPAAAPVMMVYAAYLLAEGCSRMLRDQMLGQLLLQGRAQFSLVLRNLVWVGGLGWLYLDSGMAGIGSVALVEVLAASVGLVLAAIGLMLALRAPMPESPPTSAWAEPARGELFKLARSTYLSFLFSLAYSPQVLTLLLSRFAGAEATAAFGFARNLSDQVRRYLPTDLLLGLIRPALVARFTATGDFPTLNRNASLLLLVSLLVLSPLLILGIVFGELLVNVLSHGKFKDSALYLVLLLLVLVPFSHRKIIELIANTTSHAAVCTRANAYMIGFPFVMAVLLYLQQPVWSVLFVSLCGEIVFNIVVVRALHISKLPYAFPWSPFWRIALGTALAAGILSLWPMSITGLLGLLLAVVVTVPVTAAFLWLCKPLDKATVTLLTQLLAGRHRAN